jgi:hypothetical protein
LLASGTAQILIPLVVVQVSPASQSEVALHSFDSPQAAHVPPPQSTSVSFPFFTPSLQVAAWHCPATQTPVKQSRSAPQTSGAGHGLQLPPQSTPVSSPSWRPSAQVFGSRQ